MLGYSLFSVRSCEAVPPATRSAIVSFARKQEELGAPLASERAGTPSFERMPDQGWLLDGRTVDLHHLVHFRRR